MEDMGIEEELSSSLTAIATYSWDMRDIRILVDHLIKNDPELTGLDTRGIDYDVIRVMIGALEGEIWAIGKMTDLLFFKNQSVLCTLLMGFRNISVGYDESINSQCQLYIPIYKREVKRMFERIFEFVPKHDMNKFFDRKIPELLFLTVAF